MRALLLLVVIVLILAVVGWIKFSDAPERATVTIEKEAIRQDTADMVERGNEFLDNAKQTVAPGDAIEPETPLDSGPATDEEPPAQSPETL